MNDSEYEVYFDIEHLKFNNSYKDTYKDKNIKLDINDINYNLILNKYIDYDYEFEKDKQKNKIVDKNNDFILKKGTIPIKKYPQNYNLRGMEEINLYIKNKVGKIIKEYITKYKFETIIVPVKTISRLIIGHGEVSVREVSIKLDHIYGIPFIPASSIRGAFRNYLNEKYNKVHDKENKIITGIFGSEDKMGQLMFLDIYPKKFTTGVDVMTPHYGDYYSKGKDPTDDMKPNPIKFPAIEKGAEFDIAVLCKQKNYVMDEKTINIEDEFESFLEDKPLGSKTSVGYGYFEVLQRKGD